MVVIVKARIDTNPKRLCLGVNRDFGDYTLAAGTYVPVILVVRRVCRC
jgi:hypothetical protein